MEITSEQLTEALQHIARLNDDYTKISISLAVLTERVDWIYRILWVIIASSVGAFITNIWQLFKWKDRNKLNE